MLPAGATAAAYDDDDDYENKDVLNFCEHSNYKFQLNWQRFVETRIKVSVTVQCRSCQFSTYRSTKEKNFTAIFPPWLNTSPSYFLVYHRRYCTTKDISDLPMLCDCTS